MMMSAAIGTQWILNQVQPRLPSGVLKQPFEIGYQPEGPLTTARFDRVQNGLLQDSPGWQIMVG
jgi:hypothetical protein